MVEFRFDIKRLFPKPIVKVSSNLLPHTFRGDRRQALDATSKMSEIIDRLGQLSALAQKLNSPVTTAQRLRMSDNQIIYLMADVDQGHNGAVIGLLKVGTKDLYLFDEVGQTQKVDKAPCILDFYIHESRQRAGLGKDLFETMLAEEQWTPIKCSVDRPSEKLLGFLKKHYGLERTIPQANNFVLYEGFFDNKPGGGKIQTNGGRMHLTNSPNTQLFGGHYLGDDSHKKRLRNAESNNLVTQITQISPAGRYGARRPTCSMAEIIHSNSTPNKGGTPESSRIASPQADSENGNNDLSQLNEAMQNLQVELQHETEEFIEKHPENDIDIVSTISIQEQDVPDEASNLEVVEVIAATVLTANQQSPSPRYSDMSENNITGSNRKPTAFHLSKQHTGMKNVSFGVGMAVTPTNKMEFEQDREEFGVVKLNRPVGKATSPSHDNTDGMSTISSNEGLTEQGYNDLKFYHNKLW